MIIVSYWGYYQLLILLKDIWTNGIVQILKEANTPIENVIDTLDASILYLDKQLKTIKGEIHIAAMTGEEASKRVHENDVVIVGGDRDEAIEHLMNKKISLIILTGSLSISKELLQRCADAHMSVISTPFNTFMASQQIIQAVPVEYVMQKGGLTTFSTDDTVDYVKEVMSETRYRSYPVIDFMGRVVGSISRYQVLNGMKKKVIQVDHNERSQAIDGIEEAEILEIIDHHRVADIQTVGPVLFRAEPVGCTATIVAKCYKESGVEIPQDMAGLMLGAIISDTLLFKSPTCTPTDTKMAKELAAIAGVDIQEFGMSMFNSGNFIGLVKLLKKSSIRIIRSLHLVIYQQVLHKSIQWILKDLLHIKKICLIIWNRLQKIIIWNLQCCF